MSSRLTDLLGIELPIIQAPMAGVLAAIRRRRPGRSMSTSSATRTGAERRGEAAPTACSIVNRLVREPGPLCGAAAAAFPLAAATVAPLRAAAEQRGRGDFSSLWCGQNPGGCREVPAGELTRQLAGSARAALR